LLKGPAYDTYDEISPNKNDCLSDKLTSMGSLQSHELYAKNYRSFIWICGDELSVRGRTSAVYKKVLKLPPGD